MTTGFSVQTSVAGLRRALRDVSDEEVWTLEVGSPFPRQLHLQFSPGGNHALITPTIIGVNPTKLENVRVLDLPQFM